MLLVVVMEPVSKRVVFPVGVMAMDIVDEEGIVLVVSAEVSNAEPRNIIYCTGKKNYIHIHRLFHLPVVVISSEVISAVKENFNAFIYPCITDSLTDSGDWLLW